MMVTRSLDFQRRGHGRVVLSQSQVVGLTTLPEAMLRRDRVHRAAGDQLRVNTTAASTCPGLVSSIDIANGQTGLGQSITLILRSYVTSRGP